MGKKTSFRHLAHIFPLMTSEGTQILPRTSPVCEVMTQGQNRLRKTMCYLVTLQTETLYSRLCQGYSANPNFSLNISNKMQKSPKIFPF